MKRIKWILVLALLLLVALSLFAMRTFQTAKQEKLKQTISDLQSEASALRSDGKHAQALDKLEQLQVLLMNAGKYQDALSISLTMEKWSQMASDRRSPWNYVRIGEAYLGLGDRGRYLDWMERAVRERSFLKLDYFQDERLSAIKDDPRFKRIMDACAAQIGVGRTAKEFQVPLLDGSSFALSAQKGKVVLVDFWDVRCGPCRKEMPNLKEIFRDFRDRGLEIIGISLDTEKQLLEEYLKETALPWKIACSLDGWNDSTVKLYQISATPSTWLIDRKGIVRFYDVRGAKLRQAVEQLIAEIP
jgi:peroxiredoxin/type II secretory pathway pseudopilin PulG